MNKQSSDVAVTEETGTKVLFAVYGTLKKNRGNDHHLNHSTVKFLGTWDTPPNYTMVSCGGFPAVHCEGNTSIHLEIYETSDPSVISSVNALEGYSGTPNKDGGNNRFYDVEFIETPFGTANMFVFRRPVSLPIVKSGNW